MQVTKMTLKRSWVKMVRCFSYKTHNQTASRCHGVLCNCKWSPWLYRPTDWL